MKRYTALSATALAAVVFLGGCAADTGSEQEGTMPGMDHGSTSESLATSAADTEHNSADAMFAQMMIVHHQQAVEMSDIMLAKEGLDPQIIQLAEEIKAAQGPEIEKMTTWLQDWDEPMDSGHDNTDMDGMVSTDGLAQLEAAQGAEASRLFLTQMIAHHEGAISMAEEETANGSNPDAIELANSVISEQGTEIEKMNGLLAAL
ncbi:DUF305 domain-containing protein [Arthrobacter sp. BL-252-APC-1A]|uniref:DUF305 domain-containing protein n=1 Tax=Arthrobacter sp. BL-252-APC-1A TaxID=2606622 RepID=UPI0013101426|nr:DUF305 domain-containing protein [Arthrobacter sp. BL-252-APC-1A]MSS00406.1 DUF305 domain-containing protein [Arthrobacter sp. BL-252-APC-1A]